MTNSEKLLVDYEKMPELIGPVVRVVSFVGRLVSLGNSLGELGGLTEDDTENVRRIIEAGRKENVKEMDIEMERERWVGLKAKGNIDGVDAEVGFGEGGKTGYRIQVKYK